VAGNPVFVFHDLINDNAAEVADLKARYEQGAVGDVEVKEKLFTAHQRLFAKVRTKRQQLADNLAQVKQILAEGAQKADQLAQETLTEVYKVIGEHNQLNQD
jgi:tryptophanyl-tRNA synthetase